MIVSNTIKDILADWKVPVERRGGAAQTAGQAEGATSRLRVTDRRRQRLHTVSYFCLILQSVPQLK